MSGARGVIATARLDLVPASVESIRAAIAGGEALAALLGVFVPATWPPLYLDHAALGFVATRLCENPGEEGWWMYFVVLRGAGREKRTLIGSVGYAGLPTTAGVVEIGYGIVTDHQRRGYATEAARGLIGQAFKLPHVTHVIAHTMPDLVASIGVLAKCGFRHVGDGAEPGTVEYRLDRP